MNKKIDQKNIKYGVILSYVGMLVSLTGSLFITNRVLFLIGDYNYGLYSFVLSITSWISVLSNALTASYLRYVTIETSKENGDSGKINAIYFKILLLLGSAIIVIGLAILGILFSKHVLIGTYNWNDSKLMYLLFALSILNIGITMPTSVFSLFITYKKKFIFIKLLNIFTTIANFVGHFALAYFTRNVVYIAIFTVFITVVTSIINYYYCKKYLDYKTSKLILLDNSALIKSIFIFSFILLFNSIVDQINSNVDKTLLGIFATPQDITKYQMGYQLAQYMTLMSIAVSGVYAPTVHELVSKGDREGINKIYLRVSRIQSMIVCFIAFGFLSCGKNFIIWWLGHARIEAFYVGVALMLLNTCPLSLNLSIEIQRAENKHLFRAITYFVLAIANVLLSVILLVTFDIKYAIYACLLGTIITKILSHWIAMNIYNKVSIKLPVDRYLINLLKYIIIGVTCWFFAFALSCALPHITSFVDFVTNGILFVFFFASALFLFDKKFAFSLLKKSKNNTI